MTATSRRIFDPQSGVRDRLCLLAELGPGANFEEWDYRPHHNHWINVNTRNPATGVPVRYAASEALAIIQERWQLNRAEALAFIGYPEPGEERTR